MRLAEVVGILSTAMDAAAGMPDEHGLRSAAVANRLAELAGLGEHERRDAVYVALLVFAGCTAESHRSSALFGDEVGFGRANVGIDFGDPAEMIPALLGWTRRGRSFPAGLVAMARALTALPAMPEVARAHCEVAGLVASRLGFDRAFCAKLVQANERWDGSGQPAKRKGEQIALATRVAHVAIAVELAHHLGGVEAARAVCGKRARRALDPSLCQLFVARADEICAVLLGPSAWQTLLDAEPTPRRELDEAGLTEALRALADVADLRSRFTRGHSHGVAARAAAAARHLGLGAEVERTLTWASLLHDLGRVGVSAGTWDKSAPLSDREREQIRLHSYLGERILARSVGLAAAAELASMAHERLDGRGYHRRLPAAALGMPARLLAAADVFQALTEPRPHRPAHAPDAAAAELARLAQAGALCPEASRAVLAAAGHAAPRTPRVDGLTEREVEVLRLVARGLTNKEIGSALDISPKTAGRHLEHLFEKLEVTTRSAAAMSAMKLGLLG
jgi:HD-GYP domain-containing protein (c-di-GMP phosphodiesterase class II)